MSVEYLLSIIFDKDILPPSMINCLIKEYLQVLLQFALQSQAAGLLVFGEIGLQGELLPTPGTTEGLHIAVSLHVSPQIALVGKALSTLSAAEWFLSSVSPDVTLEEPGPGERFPTERTLAACSVSPHVHTQGGWAAVLLAAVRAVLHVRVRSVALSVPGKVGAAGVTLPTVGAGEASWTTIVAPQAFLQIKVSLAAAAVSAVRAHTVPPDVQVGGD